MDRLQGLKRHLEEKPEIDGLVLLNVRHFLHERQREHDPLGFRIFEMLQSAVEEAVACGALSVVAGDRKIRNETFLSFDPAAELPSVASAPPVLEPIVLRWNDELMPALITARTRQQALVVRRLRERLLELPRHGVGTFRFKDLLDPLKRDVRGRWAALLGEGDEGTVARSSDAVRSQTPVLSESPVETPRSFEDLNHSVSASIDGLEADPRTQAQLRTLWGYLWQQHGEEDREAGPEASARKARERLPSYRQLGHLLSIPRERLPVLFALLRQIVPR